MKKGILIITVLGAWLLVKNPEYMQVVMRTKTSFSERAMTFTNTVQNDLYQFTTVHLPVIKIKTNNSKHTTQFCLLQATDDKHLFNHEPLLIVNGL
jgi:hypothetical protein